MVAVKSKGAGNVISAPELFEGEFGAELALALPWAYFLQACGVLRSTVSCGDMSAFYFFSPNHTNVLGCERHGGVSGCVWGRTDVFV